MRTSIILIGLFILILASTNVYASNNLDRWIHSGDSIKFQDQDFFFYLNTNNNGVLVQSDNYRQLISLGQCHESNFIQTCFKEVELEDFSKIKFDTSGNPFYGIRVHMNVTGPQIAITSSYNKTNIDLDDRVTATFKIKNTGNRQAQELRIEGNLTPGTLIEFCSECQVRGSTFVWSIPSLNVDNEREFSMRIRAVTPENVDTHLIAHYNYQTQKGNTTFNGPTLRMIKPYDVRLNHKSSASVGETLRSEISVNNVGSQPIQLSATLERNNDVSYDGNIFQELINRQTPINLQPGESKKYEITLRSDKTGTYDSDLKLFIVRDDKKYNESYNLRFSVTASDIDVTLNTGKKSVIGGDTDIIQLELRNTKDLGFRQISVSARGFFERQESISNLDPGQRRIVFSDSIVYPDNNERQDVITNVTITYQTPFGETKRIERELKVAVYPLRLAYEIDRTINPQNPAVGEQFTVNVRGRKVVDSRIDIDLVSDVLEGAERVSGSISGPGKFTTTFEPLYSYTAIRTSENMSINTGGLLRFGSRTADFSEEYVAPIPPATPISESSGEENGVIDNNEQERGSNIDSRDVSIVNEEKSGAFIDRIFEWIKNLFRRG